ncbi:MAG: ADP-ribosylglycohydrolase family protein [Chloroflexota bacterium]|nr:ADP-ribosylglycohydrolase family protein [Chloroflexota bacterium]
MSIPTAYTERVYAGVLGKIIGVYLGRPFEGWSYERIMAELGEITYYVHEQRGRLLIVPDDDITGTFTFLRALPDHDNNLELTSAQIGQTWLNYIIEGRTILWWGGLGNSTEHTAYLRLKNGIPAPRSGSIDLNGKLVAEQIGAQIFIDGWALVAPGDPALAVDLARRAASVSHAGEAVYAAQVIAAMESQAFVETNLNKLLDIGVSFIPRDSIIYRLIADVRERHVAERDWRAARAWLAEEYGYHRYGGNVHVVPNHGLIILSLLYGEDDFQRTMTIVNTSGWDTDCNSGNVGCLLGIKNGLAGLESGPDWRGPVADRLYLPSADPGRTISDALIETYHVVNIGRALAGKEPLAPKNGARFHFELPGAVQGFQPEKSVASSGTVVVKNVAGHSRLGQRSLALHYRGLALGRRARVATPTFIPPETRNLKTGYTLQAAPTLYPGQTVRAGVWADEGNARAITCGLYLRTYGAEDALFHTSGPVAQLEPGDYHEFEWRVEGHDGAPIAEVGVEVSSTRRAAGSVYLDYLTWDGEPEVVFTRPAAGGTLWRRAWAKGVELTNPRWSEPFKIAQNYGTGLLITGTREWRNYRVVAKLTLYLSQAGGIAVRVQGMRRYYALLLCEDGKARLVKALEGLTVLAEADFPWEFGENHEFSLQVSELVNQRAGGVHLVAMIDGRAMFSVDDLADPLTGGGVALICQEGCLACDAVTVRPSK